jgi:hypothetical protein
MIQQLYFQGAMILGCLLQSSLYTPINAENVESHYIV